MVPFARLVIHQFCGALACALDGLAASSLVALDLLRLVRWSLLLDLPRRGKSYRVPPLCMVAVQGICYSAYILVTCSQDKPGIGAHHRPVDGADGALDVSLGRCFHALFRERPLDVVNTLSCSCVMGMQALRPAVGQSTLRTLSFCSRPVVPGNSEVRARDAQRCRPSGLSSGHDEMTFFLLGCRSASEPVIIEYCRWSFSRR